MLRELLKGKIDENIVKELPDGFERIGSAIIINSNKDFGKYDRIIGKILLENLKVESVFLKVGKVEGIERVPKLKLIAGKNKSLFLVKENGCSFWVNVRKTFYTTGMQNERKRIFEIAKKDETILDMFAGVGPFSILLAKKCKEVHSVEINRFAYNLLLKNIRLNKVTNVRPYLGDAKKIVPKIDKMFDRIIMNLPSSSIDFLDVALEKIEKGTIHLYYFVDYYGKNYKEECNRIGNSLKEEYRKIKDFEFKKAGEVAPYRIRTVFDLVIG